jgi:hypothetical protein
MGVSDMQCNTSRHEWEQRTSPTARNLASGLKLTHVAALIFSRAVHARLLGESVQSVVAGDAWGEAPRAASRREAAALLRLSFWVGVAGPPYMDADELMGLVVGRAR